MKAIIEDRSRQYTVAIGDTLAIDRIEGLEEGKEITFDNVMMITNDKNETKFGAPFVAGSSVIGKVVNNSIRDPKVIVFKFKRRKGYKRTKGHKQERTLIKIESIKA